MCCDFLFTVSTPNAANPGDLGRIIKERPKSGAQAAAQACCDGENDQYTVLFDDGKLDPAQKLTVIGSQLMLDYMLFAGQTKKCDEDNDAWYCYLFYCLLIGMLVPCTLVIPKPKANG